MRLVFLVRRTQTVTRPPHFLKDFWAEHLLAGGVPAARNPTYADSLAYQPLLALGGLWSLPSW